MMNISIFLALVFCLGSLYYTYQFRGQERFKSWQEYLRKGWWIFTPLNCFLYIFSKKHAHGVILDTSKFRDLDEIRESWQIIREEALALKEGDYFEKIRDPESQSYYDIGFRTFYKYGWSKFYLTWYGHDLESAKRLCPRTLDLLSRAKCINGAMIASLPPGGKLTRHLDPMACSIRYHLGLATPNDNACFISIDGHIHSWRDGQDLMFDETYIHYAHNDTDKDRLILLCDIDRPLWGPGYLFNLAYKAFASLSVVPNLEGDKRGLGSRIFSSLNPFLQKSKQLKQVNPRLYRILKFCFNSVLLILLLSTIIGIFYGLRALFF